ncbi:hypothetical protein BaRGS_00027169, partial [Batillaria attramentaria]
RVSLIADRFKQTNLIYLLCWIIATLEKSARFNVHLRGGPASSLSADVEHLSKTAYVRWATASLCSVTGQSVARPHGSLGESNFRLSPDSSRAL